MNQIIILFEIAVSKETIPDKEIIDIGQNYLTEGLNFFENNIERVYSVIIGEELAKECGYCDYCRSKKKLDRIVDLDDLIFGVF